MVTRMRCRTVISPSTTTAFSEVLPTARMAASGGLMIGTFFMATDMVTSPITVKGQVIFAVGCGVLTALIRIFGGYPEGVCYAILIMNATVTLIDKWTIPREFGKKKGAAA